MKIVCGEYGTLDVDAINDYKPDGEKVYCQVAVAGYNDNILADSRKGTYIKTSDNGILYFADFAFKMMFDFAIKAKSDSVKYLLREIKRAERMITDESVDILGDPTPNGHMAEYLWNLSVEHIKIRNVSQVIKGNLLILSEYDLLQDWFREFEYYDKSYKKAYMDVINYIMDYMYIPKSDRSFNDFVRKLTEIFNGMDAITFKDFVVTFYELLDKIGDEKYMVRQKITEVKVSTESEDDVVEETPEIREFFDEKKKSIRKISVADITGTDPTYAAGYCEGFYDDELAHADSEGFLEQLVISRVNSKAAPIDVLAEAVAHEHDKDNPANLLRTNLSNIRENAEEVLSNEN